LYETGPAKNERVRTISRLEGHTSVTERSFATAISYGATQMAQHPRRQFADSGATIRASEQPLPGLVWAIRFHLDGTSEELSVDRPIADQYDGWLWLHFNLTDTRACRFLEASTNLPKAARQMLIATDEHQQLHTGEACVYGVFADLVCGLDGATEEIGFLRFAMTENLLVSSRRSMLNAVEVTRKALRSGLKVASVAAVIESIVEHLVDSVDQYAEDLAGRLDHIEERILAEHVSDDRQMLGRVRRTSVRLHRQLVILRSLMHRFERNAETLSRPTLRLATEKLVQRLDWLDAEIIALRDRGSPLAGRDDAQDQRTDQSESPGACHRDHHFLTGKPDRWNFRNERQGVAPQRRRLWFPMGHASTRWRLGNRLLVVETVGSSWSMTSIFGPRNAAGFCSLSD
jgi:zinc transporter